MGEHGIFPGALITYGCLAIAIAAGTFFGLGVFTGWLIWGL